MPENKKVLVVDDDEKIGSMICHFLAKSSYEAHSVSNAVSAIEFLKIKSQHFDILITDYSMPQMDGVELTKLIRRWYPRIVVIGMSGFESAQGDFIRAGAHAFFLKPFFLQDILGTINSAVRQ